MSRIFLVLSGLLFVVGFIPYVLAILRKESKPVKASWIIWASLDTITIAGMYAKGTVNGQILGACVGAWVVVAFALRYGASGWAKLDKFCLAGAVVGILLWQIFGDPILGIIASLVVTTIGSIPTFVSSWKDPSRENKLAWSIFWVSCVFAIITIPHWTLADAAQPITFFVIETIMVGILYFRPRVPVPSTSSHFSNFPP